MILPVVSVVVPTVDGREDHLQRLVDTYTRAAEGCYVLDLVVKENYPTCGHGWQAGLEDIKGRYVHFTCDDIAPHPGWAFPAMEAVDQGYLPAPQVYDVAGTPQSHPRWGVVGTDWEPVFMTALPFVSTDMLDKIAPLFTSHYFSDNWFSYRGAKFGWQTRFRLHYSFTHHWAQHQRGAGLEYNQRLEYDQVLFHQAVQKSENHDWAVPWPPTEIARPNG